MRDGSARSPFVPGCRGPLTWTSKILCIANWRVVRQGLGQRVGKALHPVCCQESVRELGNGIAIAGQVGWVVLQRVTRVQPIDGDGWVRIEVEKIGRHVCDNVEIVESEEHTSELQSHVTIVCRL